jgi:hypothetical protein
VRALHGIDIELLHPHQRAYDPFGSCRVTAGQQMRQDGLHDLPGQAEFILEPIARTLLAAGRPFALKVIDFILGLVPGVAVTADVMDARVLEDRRGELRSCFGVRVEPKARLDLSP